MTQLLHKCWRHGEGVLFWALALAYLAPVWAHRFVPTQDGPSHLDNAQILKELGSSTAGYEAYFEIRAEPIPNWTSHALLAGMLHFVQALTAEKLLVSLYILGFAGSFRYFLGAFGARCRALSWLGLLFIYNRCFWMGFYNYGLSLIGLWLIVGYCLRRRGDVRWPHALVLLVAFPLTYFTHLSGFMLALVGALAVSLIARPRVLAPVLVCLAVAPSCLLAMDYFERTGFFAQGAGRRLIRQPLDILQGNKVEQEIGSLTTNVLMLDRELFEHHAGIRPSLSILFLGLFVVLAALAVIEYWRRQFKPAHDADAAADGEAPAPGVLFPLLLGLLVFLFYLFLANNPGVRGGLPQGGYIKARLAFLPPLIWLACLRESVNTPVRLFLRVSMVALLGVNLFLVDRTFRVDNEMLERFTAGIEEVGKGRRVAVFGMRRVDRPANPLGGARHYYCLGNDNISVFNYEAATPHFPIKYRRGVTHGQSTDADVLLYWQSAPGPGDPIGDLIFESPDLRIFRRREATRR